MCFDGSDLPVKPGFGVYERILTLHDKLDYLLDLQMQSEKVSMRTIDVCERERWGGGGVLYNPCHAGPPTQHLFITSSI